MGFVDWLIAVGREYGLFVALVVYVLWQNQKREERYIKIIDKLSNTFNELKKDIGEIKTKLWG